MLENFPKRLNWFPPIAAPATEVSLAKAKKFSKRDLEKCSKIKFENVLNTMIEYEGVAVVEFVKKDKLNTIHFLAPQVL